MIQSALDFFAPLPIHLDLEQRISRLIRAGYKARNPMTLGFWQGQAEKIHSVNQPRNIRRFCRRSMAAGFTIIGFPGVGKTSAVEEILQLYPQVIYHSHYQGRNFTRMQIVWLKIECPHDGSTKGLCVNFFQAIDSLIGTNYEENFAKGRRTLDELMPDMARVASIHGIGVLVIDDIQFLSQAKSGGSSRMLNFFTYLASTIGVPVLLIATYKARRVLTGEFSVVRRGTGQGDLVWDKMDEGEWQERKGDDEEGQEESVEKEAERAANPSVWQVFLESLWLYQYTKTPCPLTKELSHVLYEETQGITDFAVKVYMLAQIRAITTDDTGEERLIEEIIRSVAQDSLKTAQRVLNALRLGDMEGLEAVEDIHPIDIEPFLQKAFRELQHLEKLRSLAASSNREDEAADTPAAGTQEQSKENEDRKMTTNSSRGRKSKKNREAIYPEGDLRANLPTDAKAGGTDVYDKLRQDGYIQPGSNTLSEVA